jgi:hypothetical protein
MKPITYTCIKRWREANPDRLKEQKHRAYLKVKEWYKITRALGRIQIN